MNTCTSCGSEVLPDEDFCTKCGNRYYRDQARADPKTGSPAIATGFHNPAVEAVAAQLNAATQQVQAAQAPLHVSRTSAPGPMPREPLNPPSIGGWSFFDRTRFRFGGAGDIIIGIALIGSGHSAGSTVFGLLFIILGLATWIITGFGLRGQGEFGDDPYSAWKSMSAGGRSIAGTGSVIGVVFCYLLFFWLFLILWIIRAVAG
jgi:hypothetical protein